MYIITADYLEIIMSEAINPAISDRICKHMNDDHGDALVLYVKAFGNSPEAESAKMLFHRSSRYEFLLPRLKEKL